MDTEKARHFFSQLIDLAITKGASDIHIPAKGFACVRIDGEQSKRC